MLKSKANWIFNEVNEKENRSIIDNLLEARGINTKEEKNQFLHPSLADIEHPKHFKQIEQVKERIMTAIDHNEQMIIYGDYDADGVTSTALLTKVLTELGANVQFYIPNRFTEGYGLNGNAIKQFHDEGISLIITVDNGIANIAEAALAKQLGIDLIITDHHEVQSELPDAYAIIHPSLSPDYTFKQLAGVGVAFQLAHYLLPSLPTRYLDLVAIGTIADLVPLVDENRVFAYHGLKQLIKTEHIGLKVLLDKCGIAQSVTERDVGFIIGPRLNAVGRLQDADLAVQLLLTDDREEAEKISEEVERLNAERQQIVKDIVTEAEKRVSQEQKVIILYDPNWHEGVLGIAASRLVNKFNRPVIMLKLNETTNELKGSARSIPAFNLFENCMKIRHLFLQFGGHSQAAGMTLSLENLSEIQDALDKLISDQLTEADYKQQLNVTDTLSIREMTEELIQQISMLAPFGMENEEPIFHIKDKPLSIRQIGQDNNHLKLQFKDNDHSIEALGFGFGQLYYLLSEHVPTSIVGKLQINEWNGTRTVQLMIEDMAINEWLLFDYRGKQDFTMMQHFKPFFDRHTMVIDDLERVANHIDPDTVQIISYQSDIDNVEQTDILYLCDLPNSFQSLENIIQKTKPNSIYVCYNITENAYLQAIPTRDEFKWLYGFITKHSPIQLKIDLPKVINLQQWSKEKVIFMLKVFLDLQFISVYNDVITIEKSAKKQSLDTSSTYQQRLEQSQIEKTLYYSTFLELKDWFEKYMNKDGLGKEVLLNEL